MCGVGYHELVSLQAATIRRDCLPGMRIDHRAITGIAWSWLLPHIWCSNTATPHYSANVSATFSPPLATLTHQDSRTRPENDKNFMSILKDCPVSSAVTHRSYQQRQPWRIYWHYLIHSKDLAALRTTLRRHILIITYRVHIANKIAGKILLK